MTSFSKRILPLLAVAMLIGAAAWWLKHTPPREIPATPALSLLAAPPDWSALGIFQETMTRSEFEHLLTTVFTTGKALQTCIEIRETEARIQTGNPAPDEIFHLRFAVAGRETQAPRGWRTAEELPPTTSDAPLSGLKIAIDPGHIGGAWAKMEERWFVLGGGSPVCEGDMTLLVARQLKLRLETLGATVMLVRDQAEPITPLRPASLLSLAQKTATTEAAAQKKAEQLFYRTAEIRARADLVNQTLKPDLVLCLHFNAEAWGDPNQPTLTDNRHLHLLVNGAYTDEEVLLADQRFALLRKLLQRTHSQEVKVGSSIAESFAKTSQLPPYLYPPESTTALPVPQQPYLWLRNLLANRLYDCPVIFMEPYVMNSTTDYARIQAGDYPGEREVAGKMQASIFREYSEAVAAGVEKYFAAHRKIF